MNVKLYTIYEKRNIDKIVDKDIYLPRIVRNYFDHNILKNNIKPYVTIQLNTSICVIVCTLKYFTGSLGSTHDQMFIFL